MSETVEIKKGANVTRKANEKFAVVTFQATVGEEPEVNVQIFEANKDDEAVLKKITALCEVGGSLEVGSLSKNPPYGYRATLPKAGGFGGTGGAGGRPKYQGKVWTTAEFLAQDHLVSEGFQKIVRQTSTVDNGSGSARLSPDALSVAIRARVSQYWLLVQGNVIKD